MDPVELSADEWRARAHEFAEGTVGPRAEEIDRTDRIPEEILEGLRKGRFMGLGVPESWGGAGGGSQCLVGVFEEIARASAAVATLLAVHLSVCSHPIAQWGTDAQRENLLRPLASGELLGAFALTEPGVGSDAARLACRYRREGSQFILNGTKMFISNAVSAGVLLVFATRNAQEGHHGISAFLVTKGTPGFSIAQRLDKLGLRGSETTEVVLQDVGLPSDSLLGKEGEGLSIALGALAGGRVGIAACALGVARAAFEEMQAHATAEPEDWKRSIVAQAYTEYTAAAALVERAARKKDEGKPFLDDASCAKLFASRAAVWVASRGVDVAGPRAIPASSRANRLFRDARVFPIVEGTTEIQELILGRSLVGR